MALPEAALVLDQWADVRTATAENVPKIEYKVVRVRGSSNAVPVPFYPKGTRFTGEMAVALVATGQAHPLNQECIEAAGLSADQLERQQLEYEMTAKGIDDPGERDLYRAGVIAGLNPDKTPIKGPNWDKYHNALKSMSEEDDA